jgi:hypothetical protein
VLHRLLIIALTLIIAGGYAELVQIAAWGSMLWRFSAEASLTEAVSKTFDGEHGCALCHAAEALRETPSDPATPAQPDSAPKIVKVDGCVPAQLVMVPSHGDDAGLRLRAIDAADGPTWMREPPEPIPMWG